ncbi:MAG: tetratricopeptide repeat protein [Methanomicrobiales archaeon]|nr:tetratricopeptide repeat protein [Methanomicrobiales archaeon]
MELFRQLINDGTTESPTRYQRARNLAGSGYYHDALDLLDSVLGSDPAHADSWLLKGYVLYQMNRYDEALQVLDRALSLNPGLDEALVYKGLIVSSFGKHHDALDLYDRALRIDNRYLTAWYAKGLALFLLERYDEAIRSYEQVLEIDPKHIDALSGIRSAMKKRDKGIERQKKEPAPAAPSTRIPAPVHENLFEDQKTEIRPPAKNELVFSVLSEGKEEREIQKNPGRFFSETPPVQGASPAPALFHAMKTAHAAVSHHHRVHQPARKSPVSRDELISRTRALLSADPLDTDSWNTLGDYLMKAGKFQEATEAYERGLEIDPEQPEAWTTLGEARRKLGCYDEALFAFQQALVITPDLVTTWILHAKTLTILGRHEDALVSCDHAIAIDERCIDAWLYKGFLLRKIARHDDALTAYDQVLAVNPFHDYAARERKSLIDGE